MNERFQKSLRMLDMYQRVKKAGLHNNPLVNRAILQSLIKSDPRREIESLETVLAISQMSKSPFALPDESVDGPIRFAISENKLPVGLFPHECHVLIAGQTGTGKSTLLKIISIQGMKQGNCIWMFPKSQELRSILHFNKDIVVTDFRTIKINIFEPPPSVSVQDWINIVADILIQGFSLYDGSKNYLIRCLQILFEKLSATGFYPSIIDLYKYVNTQKHPPQSRTARYQESILNRLSGLIYSLLGPVLDCSRGHTLGLVNNHAIFEILFLTSEHQRLLVNYLITYLYIYKQMNETQTQHLIGLDDANLIFDASYEKRPDLGLPIIHHLLTTVRKSRITIYACTQTPHQIGASIHSNAFAKIMFALSNGKDVECMLQSMGIRNPEQREYSFKLNPREILIKFASRYQEPFLATVPEIVL